MLLCAVLLTNSVSGEVSRFSLLAPLMLADTPFTFCSCSQKPVSLDPAAVLLIHLFSGVALLQAHSVD